MNQVQNDNPQPDIVSGEKYEVNKRMSTVILITLSLLWVLNMADQQVIAAVLEMIKTDLGLTDAQAGALSSILLISTAFLAFPCAVAVDRWSRRKAISLMVIIWSVAHFTTGLGNKFIHLAWARFFTGIGESGFQAGGTSWLSFIFPKEKRARIMGIFMGFTPVGITLGMIGGGVIAQATGSWRVPFFIFSVPGVILGIITWFLPDYATIKSGQEKLISRKYVKDIAKLFRIRTLVLHWLASAFMWLLIYGFIAWLPTIFIRGYNLSVGEAGAIAGGPALIGIAAAPLGGFLADYWQKRSPFGRLYFASACCALATLTHIALFLSIGLSLPLTIAISLPNAIIMPMLGPIFMTVNADVTPASLRATSAGIQVLLVFLLGGAWGSVIVGAVSDAAGGGIGGLVRGGLVITCAAPIAAVLYFLASKTYPEDSQKVTDVVFTDQ